MKLYVQRSMSHKLAELFIKYDFFNDEKFVDDTYGILLEVYGALPIEVKEQIQSDINLQTVQINKNGSPITDRGER